VESLRLTDGGTQRNGNIVLDHTGVGGLAEDAAPSGDRRFSWQGRSVLPIAGLPGTPDADIVYRRTTDGTLWWHNGSEWVELGRQLAHQLVFWAAGDNSGGANDINIHWGAESVVPLASVPVVASASRCAFAAAQDTSPGRLRESFARFSWSPRLGGGLVIEQAKLMAGSPLPKMGDSATARARVRLNSAGSGSAFAGVYLGLYDDGTSQAVTANQITALSANTWAEIELAAVDISGWSAYLRLTLTAVGTMIAADAVQCMVDIEYLAVEQWTA
jgi:hypothetical protein